MSPRELAIRVLLISIVRFSTMSIIRPQRLYIVRFLSEPARNLEYIPNRWKMLHPKFKAPQIEIQLMESYVSPDENWMFANEYEYSGKDYNDATEMTSTTDEKKIQQIENGDMEAKEKEKENDVQDNIVMPDRFVPPIGSRNIITVPTFCPEGQRKDSRGRCRIVIK